MESRWALLRSIPPALEPPMRVPVVVRQRVRRHLLGEQHLVLLREQHLVPRKDQPRLATELVVALWAQR